MGIHSYHSISLVILIIMVLYITTLLQVAQDFMKLCGYYVQEQCIIRLRISITCSALTINFITKPIKLTNYMRIRIEFSGIGLVSINRLLSHHNNV